MYKSGGYNIYPREIVRFCLSFTPAVAMAAVIGVPDEIVPGGVGSTPTSRFVQGLSLDETSLREHCPATSRKLQNS